MKRTGSVKNHTDSLAAMLIFCAFALCVLFVLLLGAQNYRRFTERDQTVYAVQNCSQYIYTKLRQAPSPESVTVRSFGDGDCLSIREDLGGLEVVTDVYCHEGWLCELFYVDDGEGAFAPGDGIRILEATGLKMTLNDGLLELSVNACGTETRPVRMTFSVRGEAAAR